MSVTSNITKLFGGKDAPKPNRAERRFAAKTHRDGQYNADRLERAQALRRKEEKAAEKRAQRKRMRDSKTLGLSQVKPL